MRIDSTTFAAAFAITLSVFFIGGCGNDETPQLPRARTGLVLRLFENFKENDTVAAAQQIAKLQSEDPGNAFLAELAVRNAINGVILKAQKELDELRLEDALATIQAARKQYPFELRLEECEQKLLDLITISGNIKMLNNRELSGENLAISLEVLKEISAKDPKLKKLPAKLKPYEAKLLQIQKKERSRTLKDLGYELRELRNNENSLADTLEAQYRIEMATEKSSGIPRTTHSLFLEQ